MKRYKTPGQLARALHELPVEGFIMEALHAQASSLQAKVQARLDGSPGDSHDVPWRETGALQASIECSVSGLVAVIGTNDPAGLPQEFGTVRMPPRPFLLPVITDNAELIVSEIGSALLKCLAGTAI